jgi:hypothetical protein
VPAHRVSTTVRHGQFCSLDGEPTYRQYVGVSHLLPTSVVMPWRLVCLWCLRVVFGNSPVDSRVTFNRSFVLLVHRTGACLLRSALQFCCPVNIPECPVSGFAATHALHTSDLCIFFRFDHSASKACFPRHRRISGEASRHPTSLLDIKGKLANPISLIDMAD